jgi:metal-sulfur cluster biosynthetic enzyme
MPALTLTEQNIREALRDCYHPEISCNIVDLGLVYSITIAPDPRAPGAGIPGVPPRHRVHIAFTLPSLEDPNNPDSSAQLTAQIQNRLAAFETVGRTEVTLVWEPPWTPNLISPEGRKRLALNVPRQPSPLVQIKMS